MCLIDLPQEVLVRHIIARCTLRELVLMRRTCRELNTLVNETVDLPALETRRWCVLDAMERLCATARRDASCRFSRAFDGVFHWWFFHTTFHRGVLPIVVDVLRNGVHPRPRGRLARRWCLDCGGTLCTRQDHRRVD